MKILMISPYRSKIHLLKLDTLLSLSSSNYDSANACLDKLSLFFLQEVAFYSRLICDLQETLEKEQSSEKKQDLERLTKELTSANEDWKSTIEFWELYRDED